MNPVLDTNYEFNFFSKNLYFVLLALSTYFYVIAYYVLYLMCLLFTYIACVV